MDWSFWLQTAANCLQIIGVIWTLAFGSISLKQFINDTSKPQFHSNPQIIRKQGRTHHHLSAAFISAGILVALFIGIFFRPVLLPIHTFLPTVQLASKPSAPTGKIFYTFDKVRTAAWSPDGKYIALAVDNTVKICDALNGATLSVYRGQGGSVTTMAWSPDGKYIASGGFSNSSNYGTVTSAVNVWDVATKETINTFSYSSQHSLYYGGLNGAALTSLAWSPNGKRIASVFEDGTVQTWNAADSTKVYTYGSGLAFLQSVAWSPDGKYIAIGDGYNGRGHVEAFDAETQRSVFAQDTDDVVNAVAWSPDSRYLASASHDTTVVVWNVKTGEAIYTYKAHNGGVDAVAWSPDGQRIASGSGDMTVQIWDASNGGHPYTYDKHAKAVIYVAWSPDGTIMASIDTDLHLTVWEAI